MIAGIGRRIGRRSIGRRSGDSVERLPAPTGLVVTVNGDNTFNFSFTPVTGSAGYDSSLNGAAWGGLGLSISKTNVTGAIHGANTLYVRAFDEAGVKGRAASKTFNIPYPIPGAPTGLSVVQDIVIRPPATPTGLLIASDYLK